MNIDRISRRIKGMRVEHGFTQIELAKLMNMTPKTYCFKENGKYEFTINEILKLKEIFNCKISDIFLEE